MAEFGVPIRPEWNFSNPAAPADFIEITGQRAAQYFLSQSERPTAVVIGVGDLAALAFIGEMSRAKVRIPEEISVIGQDNLPICEFASLRLSSVSHPVESIAETVSQRLIARLLNPDLRPEKQWIRGELFTRESTCSPAAR
jgi:DNA-binding LacI/PurR family transcriptional regulator